MTYRVYLTGSQLMVVQELLAQTLRELERNRQGTSRRESNVDRIAREALGQMERAQVA